MLPKQFDKQFIFLKNNIFVNETNIPEFTIGIFDRMDGNAARIRFVWFPEPVIVSTADFDFFNPLETGDSYDKKVCNVCHCLLPSENFRYNQNQKGGRKIRRPSCIACRKIIDGVPAIPREVKEWKEYEPSMEFFTCPICHKTTIPGLTSKIVLDHNHLDGHVRGYICDSCNTGIGRFKDDIVLLQNAISYLQEKADNCQ
ncbi:hypothetical protein FACS189419_01850 [Planctomycetales bacterium]|nr:hypothetical protein FACS189419_01850 [Planctomycetales bacterium]